MSSKISTEIDMYYASLLNDSSVVDCFIGKVIAVVEFFSSTVVTDSMVGLSPVVLSEFVDAD